MSKSLPKDVNTIPEMRAHAKQLDIKIPSDITRSADIRAFLEGQLANTGTTSRPATANSSTKASTSSGKSAPAKDSGSTSRSSAASSSSKNATAAGKPALGKTIVIGAVTVTRKDKGDYIVDNKGEEKLLAESKKGEDIARGYDLAGRGNVLDISSKGKMLGEAKDLRAALPDKPGEYMWLVMPPGGKKWVPVYVGKAGGGTSGATIRERAGSYIRSQYFGPKDEPNKCWRLLDLQSRHFHIQLRFRTRVMDAAAAEDKTLEKYDFPFNNVKNGGIKSVRDVLIPFNKGYVSAHDDARYHPVKDEKLAEVARCFRTISEF